MLFFSLIITVLSASAGADSEAVTCVKRFIDQMRLTESYRARMSKQEFYLDGDLRNAEELRIEQRRSSWTRLEYLAQGKTGIKNNGMTVEFDGSPLLKVVLGEPVGLGKLVHGPAKVLVGKGIIIDDESTLKDEYFTVNRAGLFPLARVLETRLPEMQKAGSRADAQGGLSVKPGTCEISYAPHTKEIRSYLLKKDESIFSLEERLGTFAFFIYHHNRDAFPSLHALFHRKSDLTVKIPQWFFPFTLTLDPQSNLPTEMTLSADGKLIGRYRFTLETREEKGKPLATR